jgi:hypothetical protein
MQKWAVSSKKMPFFCRDTSKIFQNTIRIFRNTFVVVGNILIVSSAMSDLAAEIWLGFLWNSLGAMSRFLQRFSATGLL